MVVPQYQDHPANKARMVRFRDAWGKMLDDEGRKKARTDSMFRSTLIAHPRWGEVVERELLGAGLAPEVARALAFDRSVSAHALMTMSAMALRWFAFSGLDGAAPEKVTNDLMDGDYIAVGSLCAELVSEERKVREVLADVEQAAEIRAQIVAAVATGAGEPVTV
jgi:hypothetical protein